MPHAHSSPLQIHSRRIEKLTTKPRLGVGAPLPQKAADGSWNRSELDSNDKLRKQLLGKNYDRVMKAAAEQKAAAKAAALPVASTSETKADEDDDDEEDGRSAMLARQKNKRKGGAGGVHPAAAAAAVAAPDANNDDESAPKGPVRSKGRKKATSYLDELLAERAKKRKKK
jgi:hypothetical protein